MVHKMKLSELLGVSPFGRPLGLHPGLTAELDTPMFKAFDHCFHSGNIKRSSICYFHPLQRSTVLSCLFKQEG